jgi:TctA family transporter
MKIVHVILKVLLSLMLLMPIVAAFGVFPEPTRDLYHTDLAFSFIEALIDVAYINYMMAVVMAIALISLWTKREGLAALLLAPIVVNIVGFHAFVDGGLFTAGAVMANVLFALNLYFLWKNREEYKPLLKV